MTALPLADKISYTSRMSAEARRRRITFGNGYSQRSAESLNNIQQSWDVVWSLNTVDMETLRAFFESTGGTEIIDWQPPGYSSPLKWTADRFSANPDGYDSYDCRMTLTQEFDL